MAVNGRTCLVTTNPHSVPVTMLVERSLAGAGVWAVVMTKHGHQPGDFIWYDDPVPCGLEYDYRARCQDLTWTLTTGAYSATVADQPASEGCE